MDIAFDTTWCPVCSRQILPKRLYVPINPPQSNNAPAPPPSSPTSQPKAQVADTTTTTSNNTNPPRIHRNKTLRPRAGGGLVHGTGRVKLNGTIKRSDPSKEDTSKKSDATPALTTRPAGPVRHKTIIDQSPVPLYCSDECRLFDMQNSFGALSDHNPDRATISTSPLVPPAPHNSYSDSSLPDESDSSSGTSLDSSCAPYASSVEDFSTRREDLTANASPTDKRALSYAKLAKIYDMPPLPPPPPLINNEPAAATFVDINPQSGVMMAARRVASVLCPEPPKKSSWDVSSSSRTRSEQKPIPGWTDGSNAWRSSVYSFSAPPKEGEPMKVGTGDERDPSMKAYQSFVASSQRSKGVVSTLTPITTATGPMVHNGSSSSLASMPAQRSRSETEDLYSKYPMAFARRSDSRSSFSGASASGARRPALSSSAESTRSLPPSVLTPMTSVSSRRREVPILKKGAEGKLLVPDVKMRRIPSGGSMSLEGSSWGSTSMGAYERKRSPLSRNGSETSIEDEEHEGNGTSASVPPAGMTRAPAMRSWSYAGTFTYPIMQIPKKETRTERQVVDGVERDVEVTVEVPRDMKRLFLFPGKNVY